MKSTHQLLIGALALGLALPAAATMTQSALPQPKTENGITYISGGIGKVEATAMKEEAKHYSLAMVFSANKDDEYLADVRVTIENKAGKKLMSTVSDGPLMLVKLPAGTYKVTAEVKGRTLNRTVHVSTAGERQLNFHWPHA
jgi:hypothetical protein